MKFTIRKKTTYVRTAVFFVLIARGILSLTAGSILDESLLLDAVFTSSPSCTSSHSVVFGEPHQVNESCSVFTVFYGENVFLGGNADTRPRDYARTAPYLFFFPHRAEDHGSENGYGFAVFGWEWKESTENHRICVSGMNEKGLAFGTSGLPPIPLNPHPERPYSASSETFEIRAMRECSTVACVIEER